MKNAPNPKRAGSALPSETRLPPQTMPGKRGNKTLVLASTEVHARLGRVLDQVAKGHDVVVTRRNVPQAVILSADRYNALTGRREKLQNVTPGDGLYALMQTEAVRGGTALGVAATPTEMGRAAVAAARRHRG